MIVAVVVVVTAFVVTVSVPVEDPAATVIEAGTLADVDAELSVTVIALLFGTALRVTVAVEEAPPTNVDGESESAVIVNGVTESVAVFEVLLDADVIVVEVLADTTKCVTVKVAVFAPAGTVTEVATVAADVAELVRVTTAPLEPAALAKVTVPVMVTLHPPTTEEDDKVTLETVAAVIVNVAVADAEPREAVIVELVLVDTAVVVTVNVAVFAPAATVTDAGRVAPVLLDFNVTTVPPVGAALLKVTVPVEETPPTTDDWDSETLPSVGAVMAKAAVDELDASLAVIVADVAAETAAVVTENVAVVAPAKTVTDVGTVADVLLDVSVTTVPPVGAATEIVTVPVLEAPPATEVGLKVTELTCEATVTARDAV